MHGVPVDADTPVREGVQGTKSLAYQLFVDRIERDAKKGSSRPDAPISEIEAEQVAVDRSDRRNPAGVAPTAGLPDGTRIGAPTPDGDRAMPVFFDICSSGTSSATISSTSRRVSTSCITNVRSHPPRTETSTLGLPGQ